MSFFTLSRIKRSSLNKCLQILIVGFVLVTTSVLSAPGAHGPNGEHLDTNPQRATTSNPKFEAFTETFELVGELFDSYLQINLHDYLTNKPVSYATIELETNGVSFSARYHEPEGHYLISDGELIETLSQSGEHEVVLTIFTEDTGDLMATTLAIGSVEELEHEDEHHHHFPWWALGLGLLTFMAGFVIGGLRRNGGQA